MLKFGIILIFCVVLIAAKEARDSFDPNSYVIILDDANFLNRTNIGSNSY